MKKKHKKHASLAKPKLGKFARNEWAIIGAPCNVMKDLVERLASLTEEQILYLDESHDHNARVGNLAIFTKKNADQDQAIPKIWDKFQNYKDSNAYDYVFVNGNHFLAEKQIVILDPRKKESLSRKLDRLSNVRAIISTPESKDLYEYLEGKVPPDTPHFFLDDDKGIFDFITADMVTPGVKGLVLAGGKSTRMGQDKGAINYHGQAQALHMSDLLESLGVEPYISCRSEQKSEYQGRNIVEDRFLGLGPFGAIASAMLEDPNSSWLVVPCDLPLLSKKELRLLLSRRNPFRYATAFLNKDTEFPEPLISIWEPRMYQQLLHFLTLGYSCPRKVLINSQIELIEVDDQSFMMNVNTPEEKLAAHKILETR